MIISVFDDRGCIVVIDYFKDIEVCIYFVGCLDYDIFGLLLFINDGEFINLMIYFWY